MSPIRLTVATLALTLVWSVGPALAASCGNSGAGFSTWLEGFKKEAIAAGISPRVVSSALNGVTYNSQVTSLDRRQAKKFTGSRMSAAHISQGQRLLRQNAALFNRLEQRYGVPGAVLVAIWGLETGFGGNTGNMATIRSIATLAYDCRRSAFFKNELMSALRVIQRGDLSAGQMRGAWAGELGQTQFLASSYLKYAVDGDGNGRRDLIRSKADALASTANYLKAYGWTRGQPWSPGTHNFQVLKGWNKSDAYCRTIALLAQKIAGGGA